MVSSRPWPRLDEQSSSAKRSVEERARAIEAACRAAMQLLEGAPDREERLRRIDPLPQSSRALLRRLAGRDA